MRGERNGIDGTADAEPTVASEDEAGRSATWSALLTGDETTDAATAPADTASDETVVIEAGVIEEKDNEAADSADSRVRGWGRIFHRNRTLWIVAGVALVCLVLGLVLGRFVVPADARQEAPEPGLVTAPVEFDTLVNDVTIRADIGYANAVEVTPDTSSLSGGPAVVTGQVPAVGAQLTALSIALEIAGRPVIVLPGELPTYRTLRFGVSGPDVSQLKRALAGIGIDPGDQGSATFDQATADAVAQLYTQAGYPLPPAPEGADESYRAAQDGVRGAEDALAQARQALAAAGGGPDPVQIRQADNAINSAQRALDAAHADPDRQSEIPDLEDQLALAVLQRDQLFRGVDTSAEQSMVASASAQVDAAYQSLETARQQVQPYLPSSEVLYLTELPRRVDAVNTARGQVLQGVAMTVSGATVRLTGSAAAADAKLLQAGTEGFFDLPDGTPHRAVVIEAKAGKSSGDRWAITLEPDPLTAEQIGALQDQNVRVRISVGATEGEVLSVPLAALTAGPGGDSRVEIVEGDPRDKDAKTRLVVVEPGLAARGMVEVTPTDGELKEDDLVVVGR